MSVLRPMFNGSTNVDTSNVPPAVIAAARIVSGVSINPVNCTIIPDGTGVYNLVVPSVTTNTDAAVLLTVHAPEGALDSIRVFTVQDHASYEGVYTIHAYDLLGVLADASFAVAVVRLAGG